MKKKEYGVFSNKPPTVFTQFVGFKYIHWKILEIGQFIIFTIKNLFGNNTLRLFIDIDPKDFEAKTFYIVKYTIWKDDGKPVLFRICDVRVGKAKTNKVEND